MKQKSFLSASPAALVVVPVLFALVSLLLLGGTVQLLAAPYRTVISWFMSDTAAADPQDLLAAASALQNAADQPDTIPRSSITFPAAGDRYATVSIEGTEVSAPVYYGDTTAILNKGVGTYYGSSGAGIPGEGKTVLMAGHNNTFFSDLGSVEVGDVVTVETHYGTYTYTVAKTEVHDYQDSTAYDFTRTDENLILYTCYPFTALGFTPDRYFVYADYTSGPVLDANS